MNTLFALQIPNSILTMHSSISIDIDGITPFDLSCFSVIVLIALFHCYR